MKNRTSSGASTHLFSFLGCCQRIHRDEEKRHLPHQSLVDKVRSEENFQSAFGIFKEDPHGSLFFGLEVTLCFQGVYERILIVVRPSLIRDWNICRHFLFVIFIVLIGIVLDSLVESGEWTG